MVISDDFLMVKLDEMIQPTNRPITMDKKGNDFKINGKGKEYEYIGLIQLRVAPPKIAKNVKLEAGLDKDLGSMKFMKGLVLEGLIIDEKVARIV